MTNETATAGDGTHGKKDAPIPYMVTAPVDTPREHRMYSPDELFNLLPDNIQRLMPADLFKQGYGYTGGPRLPFFVAMDHAIQELKRMGSGEHQPRAAAVARVLNVTLEQVREWARQ